LAASLLLAAFTAHAAAEVNMDRETVAFGETYGITFTTDAPAKTNIKCDPLGKGDEAAMRLYLRMFREEFGKYSPPFVRATGLKSIVLAKNLKVGSEARERGAIPDYPNRAVWYNPYKGDHDEMYQRHVIHHEYFHLADQVLQGNVYLTDPYWDTESSRFSLRRRRGNGENKRPVRRHQPRARVRQSLFRLRP
jgi:hypothetical protein